MIGGTVHRTYRFDDHIAIAVRGTGSEANDWCAVDVPLDAPDIKPGDGIWWQSTLILWTSQDGSGQDIQISRIGHSYSVEGLWRQVAARCRAGICPDCTSRRTMYDGLGALWCDRCGASYNFGDIKMEETK